MKPTSRTTLVITALVLCMGGSGVAAQNTTLEECRAAALQNSTINERQELTTQKWEAKSRATNSSLLPQLEVNAQASYQNQTPQLPDGTPLTGMFDLSRDQYRATLDLSQVIYGGNTARNTRRVHEASAQAERSSLEVQIAELKDQINRSYLEILLSDYNAEALRLTIATLDADIARTEAQVRLGTATGSATATLKARHRELVQQLTELEADRNLRIESLAILTGLKLSPTTTFTSPRMTPLPSGTVGSQRPELKLYDSQHNLIAQQNRLLNSRSNPKLSLFASGGYGRPGYNFISNNFDMMGIAGLRLNVPLTGWDATVKERRAGELEQKIVLAQKRDFELNNRAQITAAAAQVLKWNAVATMDAAIIADREAVRSRAADELSGGVATQSQYITELNNELSARINARINSLRVVGAWIEYEAAMGIY